MRKSIDVLNLEWRSKPARDRMMATLVCNYLRLQGASVVEKSMFAGAWYIFKYRPKVVFMSNVIGGRENLAVMKFARTMGSLGVSLISEGNYRPEEDIAKDMMWGVNKEKILVENIHMHWSTRTRNFFLRYHPELEQKILVSGGVGFDNCVLGNFMDKESFLKKHNKTEFKKMVGFGLWDFGSFYPEDHRFKENLAYFNEEGVSFFRAEGKKFNQEILKTIEANPDVLFLLKEHPGAILGKMASGIEGVEKFSNVITVKNEESVLDCIHACDFWIIYESTTAMEAWLMGKQTCLLNPTGREFPRDELHIGSPCFEKGEDLSEALREYYHSGALKGFDQRELERKGVIEKTIQWSDGLNHVRAGNAIHELMSDQGRHVPKRRKALSNFFIDRIIRMLLAKFLPWFPANKFFAAQWKDWSDKEMSDFANMKMRQQKEFYKNRSLSLEDLKSVKCIMGSK